MKINNQIEKIYHLQSEYLKTKKVNKKQELICSLQDIKIELPCPKGHGFSLQ